MVLSVARNCPADAWSTLPFLHKAFLWLWRSPTSHSLAGVTHQAQSHTCSSTHTVDGYSQLLQLADDSCEGKQTQTPLERRCPLSHHQHEYHPHSPFSNSVVGTICFAVWWKSGCQSVPVSITSGRKVNTVVNVHWKRTLGAQ